MGNRPLSRYRSLNKRESFLELKAKGRVAHVNSWLIMNWRNSPAAVVQCGWTIPGHIGSAVIRNRFRRWGREFFRRWSSGPDLLKEKGVELNLIFKRKERGFYRALGHKEFDEAMSKVAAKLS